MSCSICRKKLTNPSCIADRSGTCGHLFCKLCIEKITRGSYGSITCPSCRKTYYDPKVNKIYIEEQTVAKSVGEYIMQNASFILDQETTITENIEKIEATKKEYAKEIAALDKFKEESAKEREFIKVGEGKLFKKKFRELRKPFEKKLEEAQHKAEQECAEAIKQASEKIECQIAIKRRLFEQITMEIERMNQEYHEYKVFCRTAKQQFISHYPIIVHELFRGIEFIKTLKGSLTETERNEITKIMRTVKTLDVGMFVEYTLKGTAFRSSDITVTELSEMETILLQEIQNMKKVKVSTWKETRW